jgi:hypothetical protein
MLTKPIHRVALLAIFIVLGWTSTASADALQFSGVFTPTDNVRIFSVHVGTTQDVHIFTTAWSQDTHGNQTGGIDSQLSLYFVNTGNLVQFSDDVAADNLNSDLNFPITGNPEVPLHLSVGDYVIVLNVFRPEAPVTNLSFGFTNFQYSGDELTAFGNGTWDMNFVTQDTDLRVSETSPVPEPGSLVLIGTGLVGIISRRIRRSA